MIVSSIVTKLITFTKHLAISIVKFEYKLAVGIYLPYETLRDDLSTLNQEKLRSIYSVLLLVHLFKNSNSNWTEIC